MKGILHIFGRIVFLALTSLSIIIAGKGDVFLRDPIGITYLVLWNTWWTVTFLGRRQGQETRYDKGQRALVLAVSFISVPWLIIAPPWEYSNFEGPIARGSIISYVGLVLFAAGVLVQAIAMVQLKGSYTVKLGVKPEQRLVTVGLYRIVRHPGYLSYLLSITGISLAMCSLLTFVLLLIVLIFLINRIDEEEKMMIAEFGDSYMKYMKRTKRLIPFVY
ncbi:protein-S-isoprenylcysteine O-methyltransferase Ste14 [Youngiibacter multivorans]|uniref:Protein-S-isoprenylcysteine O-methyltransferase Ste14 n=1 Tax=Youngiibacter multivorans TaxID=937251 RepID=A0ABS4G7F6_9CLOT|nr:protein-S-isoprenylcysteine O-methyltransferase Ste14 [Youngiibacter multivorans]